MASPWFTPKDTPDNSLTLVEQKQLQELGKKLTPEVRVGKKGVNEATIAKINSELTKYQLIKIEFVSVSTKQIQTMIDTIINQTKSLCILKHGEIALLYRKHPQKTLVDIKKDLNL